MVKLKAVYKPGEKKVEIWNGQRLVLSVINIREEDYPNQSSKDIEASVLKENRKLATEMVEEWRERNRIS